MKHFVKLYTTLDESKRVRDKRAALVHYFEAASEEDRVWAIALFTHRRPRGLVPIRKLQQWAAERAGLPEWLWEESYQTVGDLAETIARVLPPPGPVRKEQTLHAWMAFLKSLSTEEEQVRKARIEDAWRQLEPEACFLFNKLLTGGFRLGVAQGLLTQALAQVTGFSAHEMAHRLMGSWDPATRPWSDFVRSGSEADRGSGPVPFCLASPLDQDLNALGDLASWQVEYKWDGIRAQLVLHEGRTDIWSRGEELMNHVFPELAELAAALPEGTILDGEILGWQEDRPTPFHNLQQRLGRKRISKALCARLPVCFMSYDLLRCGKEDWRARPLEERRERLESLLRDVAHEAIKISPLVTAGQWPELTEIQASSRALGVEGLMLKHRQSLYVGGRKRGDWWKWKVAPYTVDAVLVYAQAGHGRRATLFTDYTFALWEGDQLVPFAKAYSGLTDAEMKEVDRYIKAHTEERFGPVRRVTPGLVFELAFEGLQLSGRHKSGIAVRFPRIMRWRRDKLVAEADHLAQLRALMD